MNLSQPRVNFAIRTDLKVLVGVYRHGGPQKFSLLWACEKPQLSRSRPQTIEAGGSYDRDFMYAMQRRVLPQLITAFLYFIGHTKQQHSYNATRSSQAFCLLLPT